MSKRTSYDVVIVGGGHNGLVAAAYLARAGRSVLVLERLGHTGGAAVSARVFPGVDARLSRYSYLVSLLPRKIVDDLGLRFAVRRRAVHSYSAASREAGTGLLVSRDPARTRESFHRLTGDDREYEAWKRFSAMTGRVAERVFPTLTEPLPDREALRTRIDDEDTWQALFERPLGEVLEQTFSDDLVRGTVLTDALIGTFSHAHDPSLAQNRCFLYHVIGGGTGDWDVPLGGMGALTEALTTAARAAGAHLTTRAEVTGVATDGTTAEVTCADGTVVAARTVLLNAAPQTLSGPAAADRTPAPEGAQLKVNMVLTRLPRLRDPHVDPREAFGGTFHLAEGYAELEAAYREATAGRTPAVPPAELYCHSLTDPSVLGPGLVRAGYQTLTLFGLHAPARLFTDDPDATREHLLTAVTAQLERHLAEPLADVLATDREGRPCLEAAGPHDLERDLRLPGGHIFHGPLAFPHLSPGQPADDEGATAAARRWGVATDHPNVLLCGAAAVRGGGVSGIGGHNAAMAVLETP
ncbi:phytoene desaturase family protein [Streptomyces sp. NPDC059740]|uniref:phytoene desaturase family protein n=1 Tax=Streptomyces sp. NPDC059740 TaxID=3346926 RepID=UPI00366639B1